MIQKRSVVCFSAPFLYVMIAMLEMNDKVAYQHF